MGRAYAIRPYNIGDFLANNLLKSWPILPSSLGERSRTQSWFKYMLNSGFGYFSVKSNTKKTVAAFRHYCFYLKDYSCFQELILLSL